MRARAATAAETVMLAEVLRLYDLGLHLQALAAGSALGDLGSWPGTDGRVLAGRLAANLGNLRLAHRLHACAFRGDREHTDARYFHALTVARLRGPLEGWKLVRSLGRPPGPATALAVWLAHEAVLLAQFRDFDSSHAALEQAFAADPGEPWLEVQCSEVFELQDRYPESLAAARRSLAMQPWYRAGVLATAHALELTGEREAAAALLREAAVRLESGAVLAELATLEEELGNLEAARQSLARAAELFPMMDEDLTRWMHARRSHAAYICGHLSEAALHARSSGIDYLVRSAERMEAVLAAGPEAPRPRRVLLPVGFVRQHHLT